MKCSKVHFCCCWIWEWVNHFYSFITQISYDRGCSCFCPTVNILLLLNECYSQLLCILRSKGILLLLLLIKSACLCVVNLVTFFSEKTRVKWSGSLQILNNLAFCVHHFSNDKARYACFFTSWEHFLSVQSTGVFSGQIKWIPLCWKSSWALSDCILESLLCPKKFSHNLGGKFVTFKGAQVPWVETVVVFFCNITKGFIFQCFKS